MAMSSVTHDTCMLMSSVIHDTCMLMSSVIHDTCMLMSSVTHDMCHRTCEGVMCSSEQARPHIYMSYQTCYGVALVSRID